MTKFFTCGVSLTVLIGILIVGLIYLFYLARDFLVPVTLAIFIAMTFRPIIRRACPAGRARLGHGQRLGHSNFSWED